MIHKIKTRYNWGGRFLTNKDQLEGQKKSRREEAKRPYRFDIINAILAHLNRETTYLEIGVRNPEHNFNKINATKKYSVDPGVEFKENPVDFQLTSDAFFDQLERGSILSNDTTFDVIFIDGLHLADQVQRDIDNALKHIKSDGFIVLHDCNPPTEWHAREDYYYDLTPARTFWNGTTWKAFFNARMRPDIYSCCIDTDWGIGVISPSCNLGEASTVSNPFYEYDVFDQNRKESLNLMSFDEFTSLITQHD